MALDGGVKEEFLKLYVAYKAETNCAMLCLRHMRSAQPEHALLGRNGAEGTLPRRQQS
jgi:hypothetical protein